MASTTSSTTDEEVGFFNIIGIVFTLLLITFVIVFASRTLKFLKVMAFKIKIIFKYAIFEANRNEGFPKSKTCPRSFVEMESKLKEHNILTRSLSFKRMFISNLRFYNHLLFFPLRRKFGRTELLDQAEMLRPKATYFHLINATSFFFVWLTGIFICGIMQANAQTSSMNIGSAIGIGIISGLVAAICTLALSNRMHYLYQYHVKKIIDRCEVEAAIADADLDEELEK
jgi:hypothetical protein